MPAENGLGLLLSKKPNSYDVPTAELRFVERPGTFQPSVPTAVGSVTHTGRNVRILQQKWAIYHHPPGDPAHHFRREVEWRDVPLEVE